ncbi:MAG: DivIVA domain-containing protein [Fimbriimonadales bacterium]|nr:DivIVA domain-containing protein [Fimbriimonadales bacterium]
MNEPRRLTVLEIETKRFRRRLRGYDPTAVDAFLHEVAAHYEEVLTENRRMREELVGLRQEAERYRAMEGALKESLVLAQRSADETRSNAHKEAELIVREARLRAEQIVREAEQRAQHLISETEALEARKRAVVMELRALLLTHLQALEPLSTEASAAAVVPSAEPPSENGASMPLSAPAPSACVSNSSELPTEGV